MENLKTIRDYFLDRISEEKDPLFDKEQARRDVESLNVAIKAMEMNSPCDLCAYNPPSAGDGKPCTMCPAIGEVK